MTESLLRSLHEPRRNKYFYGKLLDVSHLQMEQCYGIDKRWLLNRLALGSGVLCGLGATAGVDGTVCIGPGVAIDGFGREIIVPAPSAPIAPDAVTDASGRPTGEKLDPGSQSTIYLCYTECDAEPTAVYVSECDGLATTAPSTTVERYRVLVRPGLPTDKPAALTAAQRDAIYPGAPAADFDRRVATEETLAITCAPPDEACVVLATVTLPKDGAALVVDRYTYRAEVFSNTVLFELIAALADRVDACCAAAHPTQNIAIVDGDNQSAQAGEELPAPVKLQVSDSGGNGVGAADVKLSTADADAALSIDGVTFGDSLETKSAADGTVSVQWRLGSAAGAQRFTATLASTGASVTARATADDVPPAKPPVVVEISPGNAGHVPQQWAKEPQLTVQFDQDMDPNSLANPDPWIRAWAFPINADHVISAGRRIRLTAGAPGNASVATFNAKPINLDRFVVIVLMKGSSPEVVSAGPDLALDAEYGGTELAQEQLDKLWPSDKFSPDQAFQVRVKDSGAPLPSGDGTPGGAYFNSFFTVANQ
jgi:hypothetical protein